jgi:hypothetical protein
MDIGFVGKVSLLEIVAAKEFNQLLASAFLYVPVRRKMLIFCLLRALADYHYWVDSNSSFALYCFGLAHSSPLYALFENVWDSIKLLYQDERFDRIFTRLDLIVQTAYIFNLTSYHSLLAYLFNANIKRLSVSTPKVYSSPFFQITHGILAAALKSITLSLPFILFAYRIRQWYKKSANLALPQAPPPPIVPRNIKSPQICCLCKNIRTNHAVLPSGYLYCYPCAVDFIAKYGKCPISSSACKIDDVRKIFYS